MFLKSSWTKRISQWKYVKKEYMYKKKIEGKEETYYDILRYNSQLIYKNSILNQFLRGLDGRDNF